MQLIRAQELCKVRVAILGSLSLTVLMVSVDVKQRLKEEKQAES